MLVCLRLQIVLCVILLMVEQSGILLCGRSVCTKQTFGQLSNSKIRLPCDSIKFWTFQFLFFFFIFYNYFLLNYVASFFFLRNVSFWAPQWAGKHNICQANVKVFGTFNSWAVYLFVGFRTNDIIVQNFITWITFLRGLCEFRSQILC